jgi:ring-1,2-phenylacetyl-CoA epoxidase subunit PaaB
MNSLDPRVTRLPEKADGIFQKKPLDQFGTFEVFVQPKDGKPFQHEGSIHAPNLEMAYVLAKETLTRRFTCSALSVVDTQNIFISKMTENKTNVYDIISEDEVQPNTLEKDFEVFHLMKRGRQHLQAGSIKAATPEQALSKAKKKWGDQIVYNIWIIPTQEMRTTAPEEKEFWLTLPDKKFRDASDYKGGDKLKNFTGK